MAYSAPRTWAPGEYPTAAQLNQDLRDNVSFLANPPAASVYRSSAQSISNNTLTDITWNTELYDTASMHDTVTNSNRITVPVAGLYLCEGMLQFQAATDYTELLIIIVKNGTIMRQSRDNNPGTKSDVREIEIVRSLKLAANDWVGIQIRQVNGATAARNVAGNELAGQFTVTWTGIG